MRARIEELIRSTGPARVAPQLAAMIRDTVLVRTSPPVEGDLPVGASRLGGAPDLPQGFPWPNGKDSPLSFLAQIGLAEAVPHDAEGVLPRSGMLYFFYDCDAMPWGYDPKHKGGWRVAYADASASSLAHASRPEEPPPPAESPSLAQRLLRKFRLAVPRVRYGPVFPSCAMSFSAGATPPPWDSLQIQRLGLTEAEMVSCSQIVGKFETELMPDGPDHRLLGYPAPIQGDMQVECQLLAEGFYCGKDTPELSQRREELEEQDLDWRLLFQLDTDDHASMMWGDCGRLYFWIRDGDLRARNFNDVWMHLQCF